MATECNQHSFRFHARGRRDVVAGFDGGPITSDGGGLLRRETERVTGIMGQVAACFTDPRDPDRIEHTVDQLIAQRLYALALGYEDLNDHDDLRHDPLLAVLVGKKDPLGQTRGRQRDGGQALAGKSTVNRLELTPVRANAQSRYQKITLDRQAGQRLFTTVFIQSHQRPPKRIVLDLDATQQAVRIFKDFRYCTRTSWSRSRRVIGKAEHLAKGTHPRFVVTSLSAEAFDAQSLYEKETCGRGEMENRIKEQQLCLFSDRTSAATLRANEVGLWFSSVAYTLMTALRRVGLKDTPMAKARCDTIRLKRLKMGAQVRITFRKVWVSLAESCPYRRIFRQVYGNLVGTRPIPLRC